MIDPFPTTVVEQRYVFGEHSRRIFSIATVHSYILVSFVILK